jgi:hypothetical protein
MVIIGAVAMMAVAAAPSTESRISAPSPMPARLPVE